MSSTAAARRQRQQAARRLLASHGLLRPQHRSRRDAADPCASKGSSATRLRLALGQLGPVLSFFAVYLGSRVDLLPYHDCLELATAGAHPQPCPTPAIRQLLAAELGSAGDAAAILLDDEPLHCSLLHQWHQGRLADGAEVLVKVLRPEVEARVNQDLELLPVLAELQLDGRDLHRLDLSRRDLAEALTGFTAELDQQLDLAHEAAMLAALATEVAGFDSMVVPAIDHSRSAQRVLTCRLPEGRRLGRLLAEVADAGGTVGEVDIGEPSQLARQLCLAWLQQSLLEALLVEGPLLDHLLVDNDSRLVVTGGAVVRTTAAARSNLLDYLVAARRQEPDRACCSLLRETVAGTGAIGEQQLRLQLQQAEPFREGGWSDHFAGQRLADTLFVHWRLCRRGGYAPSPTLLAFWRGLFEVELIARRLAPQHDALAAAVDDLRVVAAAVRARRAVGPGALRRNAEQLLPVLDRLRERVDELADDVTGSDLDPAVPAADQGQGSRASWAVAGGGLAALAAIALISHRLGLTGLDVARLDAVAAFVFAGVGGALLWSLVRSRT